MILEKPIEKSGSFLSLAGDPALELGQIYQSAPIGLALLDRNLRYVRINDQLARMHDLAVEDHLGKHVSEVVPHLFPSVEGPLLHVLNTGERVAQIEISGRMSRSLPDEGYWLISLHPLLAAGSSVGASMSLFRISRNVKWPSRPDRINRRYCPLSWRAQTT